MKRLFILIILGMSTSFAGFSQATTDARNDSHQLTITIPDVALLDIEPVTANRDFSLTFVAPTEAGMRIRNPNSNNTVWMNYSSIVSAPTGAHPVRKVTVQSNVMTPGGIGFTVTASGDAGAGGGSVGGVGGNVSIDNTAQDIIRDIYSCYTGNGVNKGHQLTYNANVANTAYSQLRAGSTLMSITYTLTDQ
jgi:hypothetical protein